MGSLQVDVFQPQLLQAHVQRSRNVTNARRIPIMQLRRHEELLARNPALLDRDSKLALCVVHLCAVEMVVPEFDRRLD